VARKKKSRFKKSTEARRQARLSAGTPPSAKVIPNKRDKPVKHKKDLKRFVEQE
jgi:hypothetical protein